MTMVMENSMKSLVLAVVASATVLGFAAAPAEAGEVTEARIAVSQHELGSSDGRQAVEARVRTAAQALCSEGGVDMRNPTETSAYRLCVSTAIRDARVQMAALTTGKTQLASR